MLKSRKSVLTRLLSTVLVLGLAACTPDLTPEELLARARTSLVEGDINAAVVDVKTALQQAPRDAEGRRLYGEILQFQRNLPAAAEEFRRSLDAAYSPAVAAHYAHALVDSGEPDKVVDLDAEGFFDDVADDPSYLAARARAEAGDGNLFAAVDTLDAAEAIDAALPEVRRARALVTAQQSGDLEAAAAMLAELVEEHPQDADAWSLYASILQADGKPDEAVEAFARAGEINPYRLPDRLNHMILLVELQRFDEAKKVIDKLEAVLPNSPGVNYAQARLAMTDGDPERAVQELDAVLKVSPQHSPSLYLSANANLQRGNLATAQAQLESFLRVRPGNVNATLMLATIHLQSGKPDKALTLSRSVLEALPENETAKLVMARSFAAEQRFGESALAYGDLVAVQTEEASLRAEYGEALLRSGDSERGVEELQAAIELEPENSVYYLRLAVSQLAAGDAAAARETVGDFRARFPESPQADLMLAQIELAERDLAGAKEYLNAALEVEPGNSEARRGLAALALLNSDEDGAVDLLREDLDSDNPDLRNLLGLAGVEERRGDLEAMERVLRRAVEVYPDELAPRLLLARRAFSDGRPGEAVDLLTTVRERYVDDPRLQRLLVGSFMALDQPGAAVNAARRLAELASDDPVALRLAAQAERANDNPEEAEKLLREAVSLDPRNIETRKLLIETLFMQRDLEGTSEELARLPESFATAEIIDFARGRIALELGDTDSGERLLRRAHQRRPNSASLLFLSIALLQSGKTDEALAMLDDCVEKNPDDAIITNQLGMLRAVRGEDALAAAAYEIVVEQFPEDVLALNNLAWSLRETDTKRALEFVDAALEKAPGNASVIDTRAMVLMHDGRYDEALIALDRVIGEVGEAPPLMFHKAQVLVSAGRGDEARPILEGLVEAPPFAEQQQARTLLEGL